jgi:heme oxygenase
VSHPRTEAPADALSSLLREGTSVVHREAERRPFMRVFFRAELPRDAYTAWMESLWFIYSALEGTAESLREHPVVGVMHSPQLHRLERLERDLDFYCGEGWRERVLPSPITKKYVGRIESVAAEFPPALIAHQWLRYMGMLGGQEVLRRLVTSPYGLTSSDGMRFYEFPDVADVREFFGDYHRRLNSLPLSLGDKQRVADEGTVAFTLNMELTDELARHHDIQAPDGDPGAEYEALAEEVKH